MGQCFKSSKKNLSIVEVTPIINLALVCNKLGPLEYSNAVEYYFYVGLERYSGG